MWMTADYDINTLLHQEGGPFFLIFRRHRFFFLAPVSDKDQHVAGGFGFLDHGGDFILVEEINHVFLRRPRRCWFRMYNPEKKS